MLKITIENENYPEQLKKINNPPKQLYIEGNLNILKGNIFSIIGSRHGTEDGVEQAKQFSSELSMQGLTIASGMAKGIDSAAHVGTLDVEGKTIAVLGSGFNHIFPKENMGLYKEILKKGGLVITEYSPDTKPDSKLFLERNRIVSGLSIGVLVVEAAFRSGTSVTARLAHEQGKKVFVLPHEIDKKYGVGTNKLIKKGAILVTSVKDIIKEFNFLTYKDIKVPTRNAKIPETKHKKFFKDREQQIVYELIESGTQQISEIAIKSKKSINEVTNILFTLEIQGDIKKVVGGYKCA